MQTFNPFLQIQELKVQFFHIYGPCLLYSMCIHRLHHYSPRTSGNVPKLEKWCRVSMSWQEINDPWPSIYWNRSNSALRFHLKDINGPIPGYEKEEKEFNFERKFTLEELSNSHWVYIPFSFKFEHIVQPPSSYVIDWELHGLSYMSLPLVEDWSGRGPAGRNLVSRFRTVPTRKFVTHSLLLITY